MELTIINDHTREFVDSLDDATYAKVLRMFMLLQTYGHELRMPYMKMIDRGIYELRIRGTFEIRIMLAFRESRAVLLHGFVKRSVKIPWRELQVARKRLKIFDTA